MAGKFLRAAKAFLTFRRDVRGNVLVIFGLASTAIVTIIGASVDLSRAFVARQKLSAVATLTCQYSTRPSVVSVNTGNASSFATYITNVNTFASTSLGQQKLTGTATPTGASGGTLFSATAPVNPSTTPTNGVADISVNVPTTFMQIVRITQIPVHARVNCQNTATTTTFTTIQEGFETACASYCFTVPTGTTSVAGTTGAIAPTNTFTATPGYTGSSGTQWNITGYCLETDTTGIINSTSPEGTHTAELDCDNGSGSRGNSAISTKAYMPAGYYELRYFFRSRVLYTEYFPTYICGSTAADVSWANSTLGPNVARTNQINVYLDQNTNGSPPMHTTIDGTQQLAGGNLIDMCVDSSSWIERSVKIRITTSGYYWLTFAADGASDSFGGQIDNIRLCANTCSGTPQDNFPPTWLAANNGGVNKILFEDSFEAPVYAQDPYTTTAHAKGGNLSNSYGITVSTCTSGAPPGWPCQASSGWAVAPYNEIWFWMQGGTRGNQYISLQGWNGFSNPSDPINRAISRRFLLVPGYYNLNYYYTSLLDFSYDFWYGINCVTAPTAANNYSAYGQKNGHPYGGPAVLYTQYLSTNFMNVYLANGQLISTPNVNTVLGGAPTYVNPDGTTSATPTVPPDNGTIFAAYNASAVNPVIDTCSYSSGFGWVNRNVNIKITKTGWYWLTFSSQGDPLTGSGAGPAVDDVKLTALGSPYMTAPSGTVVAIPGTSPQADTNYSNSGAFNGFYIVANPFKPPAANQ